MTRPDVRISDALYNAWHGEINKCQSHFDPAKRQPLEPPDDPRADARFLYQALHVAEETPRLALLFGLERRGELPTLHRQCSHSDTEPVEDNHLTCCLGVECRICPHLAVVDRITTATPEERDVLKAWTCTTHITTKGGDRANEGYVLTTDDRMYWQNLYESLASADVEPPEPWEGGERSEATGDAR